MDRTISRIGADAEDAPYLAYSASDFRRNAKIDNSSNSMVYDCGSCVVKYALCGFNFIIFILSTLILGVGIWFLLDTNSLIGLIRAAPSSVLETSTSPAFVQTTSYVMIAIGACMFFVSFLGYCGALRESRCMLTLYGILLIAILIAEITVLVTGIIMKSKIEGELKNVLRATLEHNYNSTEIENPVTLAWDEIQKAQNCCGVDNGADYQKNLAWKDQTYIIPESCCAKGLDDRPLDPNCTTTPTKSNSFYETGCYDKLKELIQKNFDALIITLVVLGLVELIEILFAFCLAKSINKYEK
ncbi:CD82 antigen isoform X1 [Euwallacea fornicatus]|uniref:CD82 antigen isoform X1 n=2 Tax=Euwallacea fornicatus TaxID=995702 RepID=UPI00338EA89D